MSADRNNAAHTHTLCPLHSRKCRVRTDTTQIQSFTVGIRCTDSASAASGLGWLKYMNGKETPDPRLLGPQPILFSHIRRKSPGSAREALAEPPAERVQHPRATGCQRVGAAAGEIRPHPAADYRCGKCFVAGVCVCSSLLPFSTIHLIWFWAHRRTRNHCDLSFSPTSKCKRNEATKKQTKYTPYTGTGQPIRNETQFTNIFRVVHLFLFLLCIIFGWYHSLRTRLMAYTNLIRPI